MGLFFSTLVFTVFFANLPVEGEPLHVLDYFKGSLKNHLGRGRRRYPVVHWNVGCISGSRSRILTPVGSTARAAFTTVSSVAAFWGVVAWGEFRGSGRRVRRMSV